MAARTLRLAYSSNAQFLERLRRKIRAGMLVNRLREHVLGRIEMTETQVAAARVLLKKVLPDIAQVEHTGEISHRYVVELPAVSASSDEWIKTYAPKRLQDQSSQS